MSKADKMLFEQGFKMTEIKVLQEGDMRIRYEEEFGESIIFGHSIKTLSISFHYIDFKLWLAINEKMKELGWIEWN